MSSEGYPPPGRAFMIMLEPYEARMLLELLLFARSFDDMSRVWSDLEIDEMMFNIGTRAGVAWTRRVVPESADISFPESPKSVSQPYGKYRESTPDK